MALGAGDCPLAAGEVPEGSGYPSYTLPRNLPMHPQPCQHEESQIQPEFPRQEKAQRAHARQCNPVACIRARPLTWPWEGPCRLSGCLRPPVVVPFRLQSLWYQLRGCVVPGRPGSSKCHMMQTSYRLASGTFSAPSSAYSSTARYPCSGSLGGKERRVRGWKRLDNIASQYSHHQGTEEKLLLSPNLS